MWLRPFKMNLPSIYTIKTYLWDHQRLNDTGEMTNQSAFISFETIMGRETCCPHQSHCHPLPFSMSVLISRLWGQFGGGKHCGVTMLITDWVKSVHLYEKLTEVHMKAVTSLRKHTLRLDYKWKLHDDETILLSL